MAEGLTYVRGSGSGGGGAPTGAAGGDLSGTYPNPTVPGKAPLLVPTATKTGSYTAAVGDLAMMNVAGGATTLNLPAAPADKSQVGYRAIGATTGTPLTINRGGSDTIGTAGATSATIPLADEVAVLQYDAGNTRWLGVANVKTQVSLDARYVNAGGAAGGDLTGTYPNPTLGTAGTAGTYGSASQVNVITTDTKGRVTVVTPTSIAIAESAVTNLVADLALSETFMPFALASGDYFVLAATNSQTATLIPTQAREMAIPFFVPKQIIISALVGEVTVVGSAGSLVRLGIRSVDGTTGYPTSGAPLADAGTMDGTSATVQEKALGANLTLARGWYFYTVTGQGAPAMQATIRTSSPGSILLTSPIKSTSNTIISGSNDGYYQSSVTAALPSTWTTAGVLSGIVPRMAAKVA